MYLNNEKFNNVKCFMLVSYPKYNNSKGKSIGMNSEEVFLLIFKKNIVLKMDVQYLFLMKVLVTFFRAKFKARNLNPKK